MNLLRTAAQILAMCTNGPWVEETSTTGKFKDVIKQYIQYTSKTPPLNTTDAVSMIRLSEKRHEARLVH